MTAIDAVIHQSAPQSTNRTLKFPSGVLKAAVQVSPGRTGQAFVQVPAVTTSPGWMSVASGQARSSATK